MVCVGSTKGVLRCKAFAPGDSVCGGERLTANRRTGLAADLPVWPEVPLLSKAYRVFQPTRLATPTDQSEWIRGRTVHHRHSMHSYMRANNWSA